MLIVQKFGGATVATPEQIVSVARRLLETRRLGCRIVVVVSAMGKTTNELMSLAKAVAQNPRRREMDLLLSAGERISMSLLGLALQDLGQSAISFTGSQAGILTNEAHSEALVASIRAPRVRQALAQNQIVVLAGFQGVSPITKDVTTLGRGGSDITALAMAAYLKADRCEILKDVDGVFSADPKVVSKARRLPKLNFGQLMDMTFWGAKVLHYRSVELAAAKQIPIWVGLASSSPKSQIEGGTMIQAADDLEQPTPMEQSKVLAVNSHRQVVRIEIKERQVPQALSLWTEQQIKTELSSLQLLQAQQVGAQVELWVTGPTEELAALRSRPWGLAHVSDEAFSSVSVTVAGVTTGQLSQEVFGKLTEAGVMPVVVWYSPLTLTVVVPQAQSEKTISSLHSLTERDV